MTLLTVGSAIPRRWLAAGAILALSPFLLVGVLAGLVASVAGGQRAPVLTAVAAGPPDAGLGVIGAVIHQGRITQLFGEHPEIYGPGGHTGVDIGAPLGTPVYAAAAGVAHPLVSMAGGQYTGYGIHVRIDHAAGFQTIYGHLSLQSVDEGEVVVAGQQIGLEGSTGWSTGPHLHFEIRLGGTPVDPFQWLPTLLGVLTPAP
ncbi:MAG: M23 family metallopeptidase [Candidatus Dormibacteria bacterium]